MKKFRIALVLLLCLMVPATACADTEAYTIRVSDLSVSMGGYPLGTLAGAAMEAQFAQVGEELATRFLLTAGDETALEANANIGQQVSLFLQGMTNAYTVSMEDVGIPDTNEMLTGKEMTALMQVSALLNDMTIEDYVTEETTEEHDGTSYQRTDFRIENAKVDESVNQLFAILNDSGAIGDSIRSSMGLSADASIATMYADSGLSIAIEGAYWYAAGNDFTYDVFVTLTQKDEPDTYLDFELYFDTKVVDGAQTSTAVLSMQPDGETQMAAIFTLEEALAVENDPYLYASCAVNDYSSNEDGDEIAGAEFLYAPDVDGYDTVSYTVRSMGEEVVNFAGGWSFGESNELHAQLDLTNEGSVNSIALTATSTFGESDQLDVEVGVTSDGTDMGTFVLGYAGTRNENGGIAGTAKLSFTQDDVEQLGLSMNLECGVAEISEEAFAIDANGISLVDMTDAESEQALTEVNRALADALTSLETNVPALQAFSMLLGGDSMN